GARADRRDRRARRDKRLHIGRIVARRIAGRRTAADRGGLRGIDGGACRRQPRQSWRHRASAGQKSGRRSAPEVLVVNDRIRSISTSCVLRDAPLGLHPTCAPQDDERLYAVPKPSVILRRPRSGRLEGRTARGLGRVSLALRVMLLFVIVLALSG